MASFLFRDGLGSIFTFLSLSEAHSAVQVSRHWLKGVESKSCRLLYSNYDTHRLFTHPNASKGALVRSISSVDGTLFVESVTELCSIGQKLHNLRALQVFLRGYYKRDFISEEKQQLTALQFSPLLESLDCKCDSANDAVFSTAVMNAITRANGTLRTLSLVVSLQSAATLVPLLECSHLTSLTLHVHEAESSHRAPDEITVPMRILSHRLRYLSFWNGLLDGDRFEDFLADGSPTLLEIRYLSNHRPTVYLLNVLQKKVPHLRVLQMSHLSIECWSALAGFKELETIVTTRDESALTPSLELRGTHPAEIFAIPPPQTLRKLQITDLMRDGDSEVFYSLLHHWPITRLDFRLDTHWPLLKSPLVHSDGTQRLDHFSSIRELVLRNVSFPRYDWRQVELSHFRSLEVIEFHTTLVDIKALCIQLHACALPLLREVVIYLRDPSDAIRKANRRILSAQEIVEIATSSGTGIPDTLATFG